MKKSIEVKKVKIEFWDDIYCEDDKNGTCRFLTGDVCALYNKNLSESVEDFKFPDGHLFPLYVRCNECVMGGKK